MGAHARAAAQPERVLAYSKRVDVKWGSVGARLRGVVALSDVMRFDLTPLRRRMQPAIEAHARLNRMGGNGGSDGRSPCEAVACARVYHVNVVLRVRAAAPTGSSSVPPPPQTAKGKASSRVTGTTSGASRRRSSSDAADKLNAGTMVLERARVVMDQNGIVRLEPAGRSRLAVKRPARAGAVAAGLAAWGAGLGGGGGGGGGGGVTPAVLAAGLRGSQAPELSTEQLADENAEIGTGSGGDSGRFKALGALWKNSARKLVSRRRLRGGEEERSADTAAGNAIIFVGDRSEGGEERGGEEDGDDDEPGLFPVGDEAV